MTLKEFRIYVKEHINAWDTDSPCRVHVCTGCCYIDKPGLPSRTGVCPDCGKSMTVVATPQDHVVKAVKKILKNRPGGKRR